MDAAHDKKNAGAVISNPSNLERSWFVEMEKQTHSQYSMTPERRRIRQQTQHFKHPILDKSGDDCFGPDKISATEPKH